VSRDVLVLVLTAVLLLAASSPSRAQGIWYYCKSSGVYYPYVTTCAEPWLKVDPATGRQVAPSPAAIEAEAVGAATRVPPLIGAVVDETGTLTAEQVRSLDAELRSFAEQSGSQMAVLMVRTTKPETISQYSIRVAEQWKTGRRRIGDGVILVIAKEDRAVRIDVSPGLEGAIPDVIAKRIIEEEIIPHFKQGNFYAGVSAGVGRIIKVVVIDRGPLPPPARGGDRAREEADQKARLEKESESTGRAQVQRSPALLEFEAKVRHFYEVEGQAEMAYECGLRSWQWNVALMDAAEMAVANERKNIHLSHEDLRAVEAYFQETYFNAMHNLSCETLINSPTMEKLDRLENLATGGYH